MCSLLLVDSVISLLPTAPLSEMLSTAGTVEPVTDTASIGKSQEEVKQDTVEGEQREKMDSRDGEREKLQEEEGKGKETDGEKNGGGVEKKEEKKGNEVEIGGRVGEGEKGGDTNVEEQKEERRNTEEVEEVVKVTTEKEGGRIEETSLSVEAEEFVSILELFVGANAERYIVVRTATTTCTVIILPLGVMWRD